MLREVKSLFSIRGNYQKRNFGLDCLRAYAIFLVVSGHGGFMLNNTILEGFPWFRIVDGVELFFVISGFLTGSILLKYYKDEDKSKLQSTLTFWKRIALKTLPCYYLLLFVNFILVKYGIINGDLKQFTLHFFVFTHNLTGPFHDFFWESWSLAVQEWFYLLIPILIASALLFLHLRKAFLAIVLLLLIFPLAYRVYISPLEVNGFWWDVTFRKTVLTRLDSLGYGALAAWIKFYYREKWTEKKTIAAIIGILLLSSRFFPFKPYEFYHKTFSFSITSAGTLLLLPFAESFRTAKGRLKGIITHISLISYPMYLINLGLLSQVISNNFPPQNPSEGLLMYAIYWILTIIISTLLYKYFEKPFTDLKDTQVSLPYFLKRSRP
ncbi:acyltransferase [Cytophagaceae bacterium ABcell3]|nr:acyltransferase [Cytophagaceae bacterium ABcell3]